MEGDTLSDFIDDVCGESRLRVEDDLGDGFVRLRSSEAERRQAAQDIRSSEDVVIELLRNARDAGASRIFLATQRTGNARLLTVLDDGQGIPAAQHERIFEPRVTSKLDSAHMDKWGMHGRGMALYSISVNAEEARVLQSEPGLGTSLTVATDTESLAEKADQSTFPRFEQEPSGSWAMRGPKNIVRTAAEFALEHRGDLSVYLGTPVEVAATLFGTEHTPRIISLMGYKIDIAPATTSLVFEYVDAPGRIGVIGTGRRRGQHHHDADRHQAGGVLRARVHECRGGRVRSGARPPARGHRSAQPVEDHLVAAIDGSDVGL